MLVKTFVFLSLIGLSYSALALGPLPPKPPQFENKEGCYVKEINDVVPFGSSVTPIGYCYRISCDTKIMTYASCGKIAVQADEFLTATDLTKPYPNCCPGIESLSNNKV